MIVTIDINSVNQRHDQLFLFLTGYFTENLWEHLNKQMRRVLEVPMKKLAASAGMNSAVIIQEVRRMQKEQNNTKIG